MTPGIGGQKSNLPPLCPPIGATVLFLNATDLDRSREYGQESIIYSLEGSSQFRINARSGEHPQPPDLLLCADRLPFLGQSGTTVSSHVAKSNWALMFTSEIFTLVLITHLS